MIKPALALVSLVLAISLISCIKPATRPAPVLEANTASPILVIPPTTPPATSISKSVSIYLAPEVPEAMIIRIKNEGIPVVQDPEMATYRLELARAGGDFDIASTWVYALVAPFPTVTDGMTLENLKAAWRRSLSLANTCLQCEDFDQSPLVMSASTYAVFAELWDEPAFGAIRVVEPNEIVDTLWDNRPSWGIVPFEQLDPKLKVLSVDGQSPIRKEFETGFYPLKAEFVLRSTDQQLNAFNLDIPITNRDPDKMTTVILTGVTALVRATAYTMETKGVTYPARDIRDFMRAADITHISNEIPFYTGCDFPNPSRTKLVFCSDPKYIQLLKDVGTDIVELTGNHFADYGAGAMLETLDIYNQAGIPYYGGGADLEDAIEPRLLRHNGNQIAFIGCNPVDLGKPPVATENKPGAAPCSHSHLVSTIEDLNELGFVTIATFQHFEYYSPEARPNQVEDFHRVADAGASIVSGSQAHFAQMMEFYNDSFIHYGLGNLFFDQMGDIPYHPGIRREFIDRYTIYNGKLMSVELLTTMLVDHSRPRLMTAEERASFLNEYFHHSGWSEIIPTPVPDPTATLTPMILPRPFSTVTPLR